MSRLKTLLVTAAAALSSYHVYNVETSPSQFQKASEQLELSAPKQEALLKIFTMAGYFEPKKMWEDLNRSKIFDKSIRSVFQDLHHVVHHSGADTSDPNAVNTKFLNEKLFGKSKDYFWKTSKVDTKQVQDWILYVSQNAFDRKIGQERSELKSHNWMKLHTEEYLTCTKILGMLDRVDTDRLQYDEAWIAGASRPGVMTRIMDYKWIIEHGVTVTGATKVLAGNRPIWAEIDGIHPELLRQLEQAIIDGTKIDDMKVIVTSAPDAERIKEGAEYIKSLATKLHVPLVHNIPVIKYSKESCPKGLFPGRTYPNYKDNNGTKLDESAMSLDIMNSVLGRNNIELIDTKSKDHNRPTTETTAKDAAAIFVDDIKNAKYGDQKEFHILFETNNPYIERQTLVAQMACNQALATSGLTDVSIILHGTGFGCKQDIATIHSEFGALMSVKWQIANPDRSSDDLNFQTRNNNAEVPDLDITLLGTPSDID